MSKIIYIQEIYIKKFISKIFQALKVPIIETPIPQLAIYNGNNTKFKPSATPVA